MPTFRSDSSSSTTMTVTLAELFHIGTTVSARVSWSATLGSSTDCASDRTLYIYRSTGAQLGYSLIKDSSWSSSHTYSGSFDISFNVETMDAGSFEVYIQTSNQGTQSCIWTNRSYCTNFSFSWSLYYTGASAPSNPRFDQSVYEASLTFRWNAGSDGVNNAIQAYRVYYRLNYGSEEYHDVGNVTSWTLDGSGWERGTEVDFYVKATTQRGDNPQSGWSEKTTRNRLPNMPTGAAMSKSVYVPGDKARVNFTGTGDPDNNLKGFEVETSGSATKSKNESSTASYVEVDTTGWTPGVSYTFRVRAYDALGACSAWSLPMSALVGLPMKLFATEGSTYKQVAQMKLYPTQGSEPKTVKSMKVAVTEGSNFKTVF